MRKIFLEKYFSHTNTSLTCPQRPTPLPPAFSRRARARARCRRGIERTLRPRPRYARGEARAARVARHHVNIAISRRYHASHRACSMPRASARSSLPLPRRRRARAACLPRAPQDARGRASASPEGVQPAL